MREEARLSRRMNEKLAEDGRDSRLSERAASL
jgi:hypothetical protein